MSKLSSGKTLLRNVIRHRDAHNKIQEEMEMWKMRGWEMQMSQHKQLSAAECVRGRMHCDRMPDYSPDANQSRERVSDDGGDRGPRYWTRRLYEFEAGDPDRWGHSGFKELYPEVFESDGEEAGGTKKSGRHKMKKSKSGAETRLSKHAKKSRKKKKRKKKDDEKRKKAECLSSSSSSGGDDDAAADRRRRKRSKSRHKGKKSLKRREDGGDEERDRRTDTPKKRRLDSDKDSCLESHRRKKRKNWKTAGEEKSDDSSGD